jgi:uncharacterized protein (TIGR02246 family)
MSDNAVRRTLAQYCQALDDGRFDDWADLFTDDVVFTVMGHRLEGPDAVRAFVEPTQQADARGRHMLSEPVIDLDGDTARVTTDYAFIAPNHRVTSAGRYHDELRREPDRWRIAVREIVFLGDQSAGAD